MKDKALAPKQFLSAPFFASTPQKTSRTFVLEGSKWTIGGVRNPNDVDKTSLIKPALDIRHGKLIFLMLSKFNLFSIGSTAKVSFSIYELIREYYGTTSGREYTKMKKLLYDLQQTFIEIDDTVACEKTTFNVIKGMNFREKYRKQNREQLEFWLEDIEFSEKFVDFFLKRLENLLYIRLNVLFRMPTPLSAACYTYLPSRAWHHTKSKPFEITLSNLLAQVGEKVPAKKSLRKHKFYRKDNRYNIDVVGDLDGAEINGERTLRCGLVETSDGKDYKLLLWCESSKRLPEEPKGELWEAWSRGGGTAEEWRERMVRYTSVEWNSYELDAFDEIPDWKLSERFYKMAKCLLGGVFAEELGYVKNTIREGGTVNDKYIQNPGALLNYRLTETLEKRFGA